MTKHTIELAGNFIVTKGPRGGDWRAEAVIDLAAIPANLVLDLALHGLKQKVADAASGAQTEAEALAAMQKAADAILAGEWSARGAGGGVDERTKVARQIVRQVLKAKWGAKSADWAEFTGLSDADQNAKLDAAFAKNEAKLGPAVDERLAQLAAERKAKQALLADLDL